MDGSTVPAECDNVDDYDVDDWLTMQMGVRQWLNKKCWESCLHFTARRVFMIYA